MGKAYKNFWSLNVDEALVVGILRDQTPKNIEVFIPLNAQMKDVDLILLNQTSRKVTSIQVKGSRAYEPKLKEINDYGDGSAGWFFLNKDTINKSIADYFIFLIHVLEGSVKTGRRSIVPHTITIPTKELKKLLSKILFQQNTDKYSFFLWVDPIKKRAFNFNGTHFDLTDYLDEKGFKKLNPLL